MFRASLSKTLKPPTLIRNGVSTIGQTRRSLTVKNTNKLMRTKIENAPLQSQYIYFTKRWQSTNTNITEIIPSLQNNTLPWANGGKLIAEQNAKHMIKYHEAIISKSDKRVLQPILFFLAVGTISFALAARMTMKDTEDTIKKIKQDPNLVKDISKLFSEAIQKVFSKSNHGDVNAKWGNFNEWELREVKIYSKYKDIIKQAEWFDQYLQRLDLSNGITKVIAMVYVWGYGFPIGVLLALPNESVAPIPVIASMTASFIAFKVSKRFLTSNKVSNFIRTNIWRTNSSKQLYTLTTSAFYHKNSWDLTKYSIPILLMGSSYFYPWIIREEIDGKYIAEMTTFYQFIAFCIASATFANTFSLVLTRLLVRNAKKFGNIQLISKLIKQRARIGAGGLAYSLFATCAYLFPTPFYPEIQWSCFSIGFILVQVRSVALILSGRQYLNGVEHFTKLGGAIFGFFYARYGKEFWECTKRTVYQQDKHLLEYTKPKESQRSSSRLTQEVPISP